MNELHYQTMKQKSQHPDEVKISIENLGQQLATFRKPENENKIESIFLKSNHNDVN